MNYLDWLVLGLTLAFIVIYGTLKTRRNSSLDDYLKGSNSMNWLTIGLSVMATQASAITFLSTPGLAFEKGMSFVQNYFGLPLALIVVSAFFIPIYYRLKVYTAYEYLEHRFDLKMRLFTAFLFLLQRGLAAGITIYAPAIILSTALGWPLTSTIIAVGALVIIYTVSGGTKAVSVTQKWQMAVILLGMAGVFLYLVSSIGELFSLDEGLKIAGRMDRMNIVSFSFDPSERYTFWTGISGGFFLALSYFGTDQSQVQRYLGGKNTRESRLGLMFNAILKIPMQFFILLTGVLVFLFFQFNPAPALFNQTALSEVRSSEFSSEVNEIEHEHQRLSVERNLLYKEYSNTRNDNTLAKIEVVDEAIEIKRAKIKEIYSTVHDGNKAKESDYVFLYFILNYLPHGIIGLLLCVIISAAMSSTSGEINALAATTMIDFYKRFSKEDIRPKKALLISKLLTLFWGIFAILFALFADMVENLIEAVNILGSLFYGTILGVFIVGLFIRFVKARAAFISSLIAQSLVLFMYFALQEHVAYLWYNVISCASIIVLSILLSLPIKKGDQN